MLWTGLLWCCKIFGFSFWTGRIVFFPFPLCPQTGQWPFPLHFQVMCETSDWRSVCPLCLQFLSDVVVRRFSQRLPQFDLHGHEGPHGHMEEDLPHVSQFIKIHVGQTDECKRQEGLTVPPDREVGKQVALKEEWQRRIWMLHCSCDWHWPVTCFHH